MLASFFMPNRSTRQDRANEIPSFVKGRKGGISVADCIVRVLWSQPTGGHRSGKSLAELQAGATRIAGYAISASTIRATLYGHPELFIRAGKSDRLLWTLVKGLK